MLHVISSWQITFNITDHPMNASSGIELYPLNATSFPCSRGIGNSSSACSCQDCRDTCSPIPPVPKPEPPCKILRIDCATFIAGCVYLAFLVIFGCYSICYNIIVQVKVWFVCLSYHKSALCINWVALYYSLGRDYNLHFTLFLRCSGMDLELVIQSFD